MADALDFIADMNSYAEDYQFDYWYHLDNLITGKSLLNNVRLSGINSRYKQEAIMRFDGAPVSLIGYPTTDGGKPYAIIPSMYAIPTNAANKEGAWAFICCLLSMDEQKSNNLERNGGFPVIKSAVQPLLNESSVNLNSINNDSSGSYIMRADEDPNYEKPLMTDEKKQQLADYISNAELLPYKSEEAEEIICEEFQAVINGKLSSDKCIELLRDRLATFLAERK
jgi:ABC-type glycerol-3-phosphate transport system substrate-binding protein